MDPQIFIRLSIESLGLRIPVATNPKDILGGAHGSSVPCLCEIRLKGFPVQTAAVPLVSTPETTLDSQSNPNVFYLEQSDIRALMGQGCFLSPQAHLEIGVYMGRKSSYCGISSRRQLLGVFRVEVRPEWIEGKPTLLHNGWVSLGRNKPGGNNDRPELHLTVKLDPDPRYVFQFEGETMSSPQIAQLQGSTRQPIFSCKFSRDRRASQLDPLGNYWSISDDPEQDSVQKDRKGWKVIIHDLSGFAVAAAFMATPFVPSMGSDRVDRSNPGAWLILRPDPVASRDSWQPWGRLEAWRENSPSDSVCLRLHLLPEIQESGLLVSEIMISAQKGGEFFIDMDKQTPVGAPVSKPQSSSGEYNACTVVGAPVSGFVMNCKVQGEGKSSKPLVQLAMQHVTCVEDAAIFMALAAAVDLSMEACRLFTKKVKKGARPSSF